MVDYPINHGGGSRGNGGNARFLRAQERGEMPRWIWTPKHEWACKILAADLTGSNATQTAVVTIPASGFVSGRLTLTFSGGGLAASVDVVADAATTDANTDLGNTLETARNTAIAGDLDGVLASVEMPTTLIVTSSTRLTTRATPRWARAPGAADRRPPRSPAARAASQCPAPRFPNLPAR